MLTMLLFAMCPMSVTSKIHPIISCSFQVVSALGGAVTFGGSRDQGALQIAIFLDGEKVVRWCDGPDAANDALAELWEGLDRIR